MNQTEYMKLLKLKKSYEDKLNATKDKIQNSSHTTRAMGILQAKKKEYERVIKELDVIIKEPLPKVQMLYRD